MRIKLPLLSVGLVLVVTAAASQPLDWDVVRSRTESRLARLVEDAGGVTGLVATDLLGRERFAVNEDVVFPQGSAIKILILLEVLRQAESGDLTLDARLPIRLSDQVGGSGIIQQLGAGSELTIRDLATLMIVSSDNTATNILIDRVGMEGVNRLISDLGLEQTVLQRRMMDFSASARGEENLSTPAEASEIMLRLARGELISESVSAQAMEMLRKHKTGVLRSAVPANVPLSFKEGGIPGVLTTWGVIELPRGPIIVVFMHKLAAGDEADQLLREIGALLVDHYSRLARATLHGAYVGSD